ncbi:tetratricopeptide repeat protein [Thiomicrospira microaerophila]|uniref:L,D-transpeptidase Cds6 family protein n=1 Tax=Thiomicrospira microaerophila TaxID=406020 RepID=UPI0020109EF3|nr:tetratricopeptide repeat protein [Thiomicrospira microaerophila]UQB42726.1 tetratricopeptide repeat protein [Thiomicrospira microaerophila]
MKSIKFFIVLLSVLFWLKPVVADQAALDIQGLIDAGQFSVAQQRLATDEISAFQQGYLQGWLALKQNQRQKALEIWQELRKSYPNHLALGNNVSVLLMENNKFDEALTILEQTLHADREVSKALDNLNKIYSFQAQKAYNNVFKRIEPSLPKGTFLALTESRADVVVVESGFADRDQVLEAVETWRQAWSSQNVRAYLQAYHPDFLPPQGQSIAAWRNARTRSVSNPRFIDVFVSDVQLFAIDEDNVRIQFTQRYRSDRFQDEVVKVLLMTKSKTGWKIIQETVIHEN